MRQLVAVTPTVAAMSMAFKRVDGTFMGFLFSRDGRLMRDFSRWLESVPNSQECSAWAVCVHEYRLNYSATVISSTFESAKPFIDVLPLN